MGVVCLCVTVVDGARTGPAFRKSSVLLSPVQLAIHRVDTCYLYRFSTLHVPK